MRVRFAELIFDSATRELTRAGRRVNLTPKALAFLEALLESRPRALSKSELRKRLWPDTYVSALSLPRVVTEVRKALDDDARMPRFVRTVFGFGYAFCAEAEGVPADRGDLKAPAPNWFLLWGAQKIPLAKGETLLGRASDCTVSIPSSRISRHHAKIVVTPEEAVLEDLRSKNGTFLRGRRLEAPARLEEGDEIAVGGFVLIFRTGSPHGSTITG